ncbi:class I SAM-dependent methyltransferase [Saccharothrix violaceirubra]|uniref:Demethylmacrocin O-methyltransferase n=1 Tax=Saccharothrix violaceirubra TaxID=413306 RepID=A0A7W7T4W2_9PSEU|nr:class I SAM-dependent methyltransferase [Saccharothrix violaceirubra]MBB4966643.1 demethylmacrocin O-methyltransferase [Saccharothrix violaceirubra]
MDVDALERLIEAAGGGERRLAAVTDEFGLAGLAPLLAGEIAFRATTAARPGGGNVALGVRHRDRTERFVLTVAADGRVTAEAGTTDDPALSLDYDLHDLVRLLFGPTRPRATGHFAAEFLPPPQPGHSRGLQPPDPMRLYGALQTGGAIAAGLSRHHPDLAELCRAYGTDKWGGVHWFADVYERHLREFRDVPLRVLEIGVGGYAHPSYGGESLRVWKRYFHRGLVFGVDVFDKSGVDEPRIVTAVVDQSDPDALVALDERYGPFDIVIDDGSHVNAHVRTALDVLFPRLRPGGLYVIEDLWTSYCAGYGGDEDGPAGDGTSIGLLKRVAEGIQYRQRPGAGDPTYLERHVVGLHVYHNIAFLEKGVNDEGGVPAWVPRRPL